jgi:hypothetical protein
MLNDVANPGSQSYKQQNDGDKRTGTYRQRRAEHHGSNRHQQE